jgi:hypothetical protein
MNINIPSGSLPAGAGAAARLLHEAQVLLQSERPKSPAVTGWARLDLDLPHGNACDPITCTTCCATAEDGDER